MKVLFTFTLLVALIFLIPESQAQGVIQQFGSLIAGDNIMSQGNNRAVDAGNSSVPTLPGTRPVGVGVVNSGFGFCQWNPDPGANTAWNQLCWGFNSSGAGVINYSNMNTAANNLLLQVNGNTDLTLNNFGASGVTQPCSDASSLLATDAYAHSCVSITGGITAASNSVLEATPSTATTSIVRLGFATPGDAPPLQFISSNSACSLNSGAGDGGSQVPSSDGKCWIAKFAGLPNLLEWGPPVNNSANDAGPAVRAACHYAEVANIKILTPTDDYYFNSFDPRQASNSPHAGALITGDGVNPPSCSFVGPYSANFASNNSGANTCEGSAPYFKLGNAVNLPLLTIRVNAITPDWEDICLSGNKSGQTGWVGSPDGLLPVVNIEDSSGPATRETAWYTRRVVVRDGFNNSVYLGAGRGGYWSYDSWFYNSGQTTGDPELYLNGFDSTFINDSWGGATGTAFLCNEGQQYAIIGGASFFNYIGGTFNATCQITVTALLFQNNGTNLVDIGTGAVGASRVCTACVFMGVSINGGSSNDVSVMNDNELTLDSPQFLGPGGGGFGYVPVYNIGFQDTSSVVALSGTPYFVLTKSASSNLANNNNQLIVAGTPTAPISPYGQSLDHLVYPPSVFGLNTSIIAPDSTGGRGVFYKTGLTNGSGATAVSRWYAGLDPGSTDNYIFNSYDSTGTFVGNILTLNNATGAATLPFLDGITTCVGQPTGTLYNVSGTVHVC